MKWISNTYDPGRPDAYYYGPTVRADQTHQEAYDQWKHWLRDKMLGEPKATEAYSSQQLVDMGMVGVYVKEENS